MQLLEFQRAVRAYLGLVQQDVIQQQVMMFILAQVQHHHLLQIQHQQPTHQRLCLVQPTTGRLGLKMFQVLLQVAPFGVLQREALQIQNLI